MESDFWIERWQSNQIGFHQETTNPCLERFWPSLRLPQGSDVFVPLCGKSLDMVWLAGRGHRVIGIELSEIAIDAFFESQGLVPEVRKVGSFTVKSSGPYELWCGDIFDMPAEATANAAATYDRASMIALPPAMRAAYAERLRALVPAASPVFLITLEYDQERVPGPPFAVPEDEVRKLYEPACTVEEIHCAEVEIKNPKFMDRGVTHVGQRVFIVTPR